MTKKALLALLMMILLAGIFSGCARGNAPARLPAALSEANADLGIRYARNFNIDYLGNGVKLLTDSGRNRILLVPKGVNIPSGYNDAVLIETPITSALYTSTTYVGFLGALEVDSLYDSVAAVCTPEEDWTSPEILRRFRNGTTHYVNHSQMAVGGIEEIIKIKPDFVFTGGNDNSDMQLRYLLDAVNIKHATLLDWMEEGNAANLEWIKFFATFFNLDEKADYIFRAKLAQLDELYEKTARVSDRPTVVYGTIWNGVVHTQAGNSALVRQFERAGGAYALKELESPGSVMLTMEEFLARCRDTDIVIYGSLPQYCPDKTFLLETEPLMAEFRAFNNGNIYIFQRDYYMNNAKVVEKFEDIACILHPDLFPGHELLFYQKLPD
jgi:iron complex transport system substrate-binding protein